jgi:hypothetical protein
VSLVSARERLVTMPNDEKPGGSATDMNAEVCGPAKP